MAGDEGVFYRIRYQLRGQLARRRGSWTPNQEAAWNLLNEVEHLVHLLKQLERSFPADHTTGIASEVRHTLLMHQPACKEFPEASNVQPSSVSTPQGDRQREGEEGTGKDTSRAAVQPPDQTNRPDARSAP